MRLDIVHVTYLVIAEAAIMYSHGTAGHTSAGRQVVRHAELWDMTRTYRWSRGHYQSGT